MSFSFSKLFQKNVSNATSSDTVEAILKDIENKPYAVSENNVLYGGLNELGGYFYFQTVIVGSLRIKCKTGAQLVFKGNGFELTLIADALEFETNTTPTKGRHITNIDFQIEKSDIKKLEKATPKALVLKVKQQELRFTKHKATTTK